jgi:hypothetical protein
VRGHEARDLATQPPAGGQIEAEVHAGEDQSRSSGPV